MAADITLKEQLERFADSHLEEMIGDLFELCRIESVCGPKRSGAPFGQGALTALKTAGEMCAKRGFAVKDYDGYVCAADFGGDEPAFDILGHVDVVPAGDGWTVTGPFAPKRIGDMLYGRGTADDKGGVIAALYAMQALKELGVVLSKRCRLIIGSGEEIGMKDVEHYYSVEQEAPMTATPDAEYPVTCGEKGRIHVRFDAPLRPSEGERKCILLAGGIAVNQVPASARACLMGVSEEELARKAAEVSGRTKAKFGWERTGEMLFVHAAGISAHGSRPEFGINALQALGELVLSLDLDPCEGLEKLDAYMKLYPFGEYDGTSQGMDAEDEISGKTTCAPGILAMTETHFHGEVDYRTAIAADRGDPAGILRKAGEKAGFAVSFADVTPSHYVPGDSPFVKTLNECYEAVSGKKGAALCVGGNSYVHCTKGGVCFGFVTDNAEASIHGPNEHLPVKDLRDTVVIYGLAIANLCR